MLSDLTIRHALASVCDVVFQRWRPKEILLISRYRWQVAFVPQFGPTQQLTQLFGIWKVFEKT
jgi:hypothetical protein